MARALAGAIVVSLLAVSGASGAPAQTPKRGGTLVIGTAPFREPACLNPFVTVCGVGLGSLDLVRKVLPGAFEVTADATFSPNLVSSATVSKKPFRLTYHIRPQARWSDGVPVTASDFVFTDRVIRTYRPQQDLSSAYHLHRAYVRSVRVLDAKTVRVVLSTRYPDWRYLFDIVLPRHALAGEDFESLWKSAIDNPKTRRAIGSGPFLFEGWDRGRQLTFVRNPRYWRPHSAYLARLVYRFLRPETMADAVRGGELDMIDPRAAANGVAALELGRQRAPGTRVVSYLGGSYEQFAIRRGQGGHPALERRLVRQALAYGIDRGSIARTLGVIVEDAATREPLDSVVFLANSPYYRPNWKSYRYRPAHARRLLEQAGCRRGQDGVYSCDGERLELRFVTAAGVDERRRIVSWPRGSFGRPESRSRPSSRLHLSSSASSFRAATSTSRSPAWDRVRARSGPWRSSAVNSRGTSLATAIDSSPATSTRPRASSTTAGA